MGTHQTQLATGAVCGVHNGQKERSALRRVRVHLSPDETEQRLLRRFAIINVWRPIGAPLVLLPTTGPCY